MFILFNFMHVRALFITAVCYTKVSNVSQLYSTDQPRLVTGQPAGLIDLLGNDGGAVMW